MTPGDPPPPPTDPGGIHVITDDTLAELATLENVVDWTARIELKDTGQGTLVLSRYDDQATEAILKQAVEREAKQAEKEAKEREEKGVAK